MAEESQNVTPNESATATNEAKYNLTDLVNSGAFSFTERNILKVALSDDEKYSVDEAKQAINNFRGGAK